MQLEQWAIAPAFVSGDPHSDRLRVRYFRRQTDEAFVAKAWFGPRTEGPPGHAHGGSIAAVLDEAMGAAAWFAGHAVVAARLTVDFRAMLPLETVVLIETRLDRVEGRKVHLVSRMTDPGGTLISEGSGLFIKLAEG